MISFELAAPIDWHTITMTNAMNHNKCMLTWFKATRMRCHYEIPKSLKSIAIMWVLSYYLVIYAGVDMDATINFDILPSSVKGHISPVWFTNTDNNLLIDKNNRVIRTQNLQEPSQIFTIRYVINSNFEEIKIQEAE